MKFLALFLVAGFLVAGNQAVVLVSRAGWGARAPTSTTAMATPVGHVVIHHSEGAACTSNSACEASVRGIQNYHMNSNGWSDIGYNFLVGGDNRAYEGRGWSRVGAHAPGFNDRSIGICAIGSFSGAKPPAGQITGIKELIVAGVNQGRIRSTYKLIGHRQATSTDCPGTAFYNEIKTWPNWTASPTYEDIIEGRYVYDEVGDEFVPAGYVDNTPEQA